MNCGKSVPFKAYKAQRQGLGISMEAFAAMVGVSCLTLRRWEEGRVQPTEDNLQRWRRALRDGQAQEEQSEQEYKEAQNPNC